MVKQLRTVIKSSFIGKVLSRSLALFLGKFFQGSKDYWELRYQTGGTSGVGSYGRLAEFKAEVINSFVAQNNIKSVLELGCGDGHQLSLACFPNYIGLDVSRKAIAICAERFHTDKTKSFFLYDPFSFIDNHNLFRVDLALSLDVIFHLVEDNVFESYMTHLFGSAQNFVIVYSTDYDQPSYMPHVRHRHFSSWIKAHCPAWSLIKKIDNQYPPGIDEGETSQADFFIYQKQK